MPDSREAGWAGRRRRSAAHEDEALDEVLDRSELVGDVQNRHAEVRVQLASSAAKTPATRRRRRSSARRGRGRRLACERLRDERPLLHPARQRPQRCVGLIGEPDSLDRAADDSRSAAASGRAALPPRAFRPRRPPARWREPRRRAASAARDSRASSAREPARLAVEPLGRRWPLQSEHDPDERRLPAAVRPCDRRRTRPRRPRATTSSRTCWPARYANETPSSATAGRHAYRIRGPPQRREIRPHDREVVVARGRRAVR